MFVYIFSVRFQGVLLKRLVFALMRKEELVPNAEDWAYKVAKNHKALQEGGTLRYCNATSISSIYLRWLKTADISCQSKGVDKMLL